MTTKSTKQAREERERMLIFKHKFENRITIAKFGKESLDAGDYGNAIHRFGEYMEIMAEYKKTKDFYSLRVSHFDPKTELTEMLMMSHIFFEMARVYDAVPKFQPESKRCLDQFVAFSSNQPYQVVNSELIRKHLKKSVFKQPELFQNAHRQIYVQSKKCYVVTFCYGTDHPLTREFRLFKDWLLDYAAGREAVRIYYQYSSVMVEKWEKNPFITLASKIIIRPLLVLFSKTILRLILPKC